MFKLTPSELLIYEAMRDDPGRVWTTEHLADLRYGPVRPRHWRGTVVYLMKSLRMKTIQLGSNRVVKVSKSQGRGQVGKWTLQKTALRLGLEGE